MEPELLSVTDVATRLGLTPRAIYHMIDTRRLPHIRQGKLLFVPKSAFNKWLATQNEAALASVGTEAAHAA